MSTVSLHNRIRGQRLRGERPDMPPSPGSRGCAPGLLRVLLPPCCSNPRQTCISPNTILAALSVRLCECMPWVETCMKSAGTHFHSEIPAKIAVFLAKASSQRANTNHNTTRSYGLEARAGAFPPFFPQHAMPP